MKDLDLYLLKNAIEMVRNGTSEVAMFGNTKVYMTEDGLLRIDIKIEK